MATVKRRSTVPYYAAAGTWVIYALLFPLYRVPHFLFVAVVSGVVFFIMNAVCGTVEVTVPDPPKKEETTGNPELDKMIRDGNLAISEMKRLNDSIKDAKISADIDRLEDLSAKIFAQVKADPKKLPQIRKFFSDLQQLFISFLLFSSYSLKLQNPLVPASAKLQGQILLRFHELSVHQHIYIGQHLVCHLCMDNAAGCQIPIPEIAAIAPDILLRIRLAHLLK